MMNYRYTLDTTSDKYECPSCHKKTFVRYIDTETGELLDGGYGRCDREVKCGYFLKPTAQPKPPTLQPNKALPEKKPVFVPEDIVKLSLAGYERNNLFKWLVTIFGNERAVYAANRYRLGTSKYFGGSAVFWYANQYGVTTRGKVIAYQANGHRRKEDGATHSVHSLLKLGGLPPLHFYGLHLLDSDKSKTVAICESEKTAIVASLYFSEYVWLATGSLSNLTAERMKPLRGRKIVLFPDAGAFDMWQAKADSLHDYDITVFAGIENALNAKDRQTGYDIADYIYDALQCPKMQPDKPTQPPDTQPPTLQPKKVATAPLYTSQPAPKQIEPAPKQIEPAPKQIEPEPIETAPKQIEPAPKQIEPAPKQIEPESEIEKILTSLGSGGGEMNTRGGFRYSEFIESAKYSGYDRKQAGKILNELVAKNVLIRYKDPNKEKSATWFYRKGSKEHYGEIRADGGLLDGLPPFYDDDKASVKHRPLEDDAPKAIEPELQTNGKSPQLHADDAPKANDDAPKVPSWIIPDSENPYPY